MHEPCRKEIDRLESELKKEKKKNIELQEQNRVLEHQLQHALLFHEVPA